MWRADYLDRMVTLVDVLRHHDRSQWPLLLPKTSHDPGLTMQSQWAWLATSWAWGPWFRQMHGKLLLAHLRGEPLPPDPFLTTGTTMQPIMRNGVLIGAYSVGQDGRDDGGDQRTDLCFDLGPTSLGYPKASVSR
jgi:hypothetical protein